MIKGRGIKFGVIGTGAMGKNHGRIASTLAGLNLVGVSDINLPSAEEFAAPLKIKAFGDYKDLLPLTEALSIATPTLTHFSIASDCLNAGRHVLLEKPFTGSAATARSIINLAQQKGLILTAGLIERYNPAFQRLLKEIKGEKIIGVDIKRLSPFPERIADTDVIFDMMLHDLDLLLQIVPDEIIDIQAKGEKIRTKMIDRAIVSLTHKSGTISRIEASRVFSSRTRKITVTTEKFLIEADLLNKTIYIRDFSSPTPSTLPVKPVDQLTEELKDFIRSIKQKGVPTISHNDILRTLTLAEEVKKAC
ncbi:MAG: Gfo/Idh/MocA family oxidoreductase [Candidatus Margulisbacteria bacterium]|nr:Gfo/Idh/MocA family oxidoreductase [Candidatus Margulisiibacteriota bacterium]